MRIETARKVSKAIMLVYWPVWNLACWLQKGNEHYFGPVWYSKPLFAWCDVVMKFEDAVWTRVGPWYPEVSE